MYENTIRVLVIIGIGVLYLLPTLIAFGRDIPRRNTIFIFNIILGWTGIGWIVCFLWALLAQTEPELT